MQPPANPPSYSERALRDALGMYATGVAVVTARTAAGERLGLTVNSFNALSLSPALILWALGVGSSQLAAFQTAGHYAVNVLNAAQRPLAERFATRGIKRWDGVAYSEGLGGAPLLDDAAAILQCRNLRQSTEGDHLLFIGQVEQCSHQPGAGPLLYHGGRFYTELPLGAGAPNLDLGK